MIFIFNKLHFVRYSKSEQHSQTCFSIDLILNIKTVKLKMFLKKVKTTSFDITTNFFDYIRFKYLQLHLFYY